MTEWTHLGWLNDGKGIAISFTIEQAHNPEL